MGFLNHALGYLRGSLQSMALFPDPQREVGKQGVRGHDEWSSKDPSNKRFLFRCPGCPEGDLSPCFARLKASTVMRIHKALVVDFCLLPEYRQDNGTQRRESRGLRCVNTSRVAQSDYVNGLIGYPQV